MGKTVRNTMVVAMMGRHPRAGSMKDKRERLERNEARQEMQEQEEFCSCGKVSCPECGLDA